MKIIAENIYLELIISNTMFVTNILTSIKIFVFILTFIFSVDGVTTTVLETMQMSIYIKELIFRLHISYYEIHKKLLRLTAIFPAQTI